MSNDEKSFLKQFAAQLGQALREQEETAAPPRQSVEESLFHLYRSLCFDEPLVEDIDKTISNMTVTTSSLCRKLLQTSPSFRSKNHSSNDDHFAISNRLVNGIIFLCQQSDQTATTTTTTTTTKQAPRHSLSFAKLAFCVLIQVPLECCEQLLDSSSLGNEIGGVMTAVRRLLGSYKGSLQISTTASTEPVEDTIPPTQLHTEQEIQKLSTTFSQQTHLHVDDEDDDTEPGAATNSPHNGQDHEFIKEEEEVWAAESDPFDYDFGDETHLQFPQNADFAGFDDLLDPHELSKPDSTLTNEDAQVAIGSLLQRVNYSLLEPLFLYSKPQDLELYISQLTHLLLLLLQPKSTFLQVDATNAAALQAALLSPLWVLRDAALHTNSTDTTHQTFCTNSYLQVLQTLLAVDQAHIQDLKASSTKIPDSSVDLCTASIVGLSALSSWCSSATISIPLTQTALLGCMNDLAHIVERGAATQPDTTNLRHSLLPILELLAGISFGGVVRRLSATTNGTASSAIPQALMNSGFLRELLQLAFVAKPKDHGTSIDSDALSTQHIHFHHALWGLCVAYPKIVGKYVFRYPGVSQMIRSYVVVPGSKLVSSMLVECILWHLFANQQCGAVDAPKVVWKKPTSSASTTAAPPLSIDECETVLEKSWAQLCGVVAESIRDSSEQPKTALIVLQDWERLLSFVAGIPLLGLPFRSMVANSKILQVIREALSNLPNLIVDQSSTKGAVEEKSPEEDDAKKPTMSDQQRVMSKTRKLLKEYTLYFQDSAVGSSKTD